MEQYTTEDEGLFLYDDFNKARDRFLKELTVPERAYISRNTNYHAETIPQELFRILPRNEKRKLLDSINERAKLDRLTLQPIDQQIKDSFESLADKIESQED
jgi:predicted GTPase